MNKNATKIAAGAAAVIAIGIGAAAVGSASSSDNRTQNASFGGPPGATGNQQMQPNQQAGATPPGFGTEATGADAEKAKEAALKKYPGTAEKVMKLQDGSYVVHVITGDGELHVLVDSDFNVTGKETGGRGGPPPGGMMPPGGGQVPQPPGGGQTPQPPSGSGSGSTT
jgi:hypothetical protein